MSDEIMRKVEVWLCAEMVSALPGSRAVPSKGGDATEDADEPEPPFTFVKVTECQDITPPGASRDVYQCTVKVARVSHINDTSSPAHSAAVRQFKDALRAVTPGRYDPLDLVINGLAFLSTEAISDTEKMSHADVITMVVGAAG